MQCLEHPNSVFGICGITILAEPDKQIALVEKFGGLYGDAQSIEDGYCLRTANGQIQLLSSRQIQHTRVELPACVLEDGQPSIVGMDLRYSDVTLLKQYLQASSVGFDEHEGVFILNNPQNMGNTILPSWRLIMGLLSYLFESCMNVGNELGARIFQSGSDLLNFGPLCQHIEDVRTKTVAAGDHVESLPPWNVE